jgi:serine protease inhibitor
MGKFDSEPTTTNNFYIHSSESEQLSETISSSGDMSYREDQDIYYANVTGSNTDMND